MIVLIGNDLDNFNFYLILSLIKVQIINIRKPNIKIFNMNIDWILIRNN